MHTRNVCLSSLIMFYHCSYSFSLGFSLKVVSAPSSDHHDLPLHRGGNSDRRPPRRPMTPRATPSSPANSVAAKHLHRRRRSSSPLVVVDAPPSTSSHNHVHGHGHGGHTRPPHSQTINRRGKRHSARAFTPTSPYTHAQSSRRKVPPRSLYDSHSRNGRPPSYPHLPSRSPSPQFGANGVRELSATSGDYRSAGASD